MKTKPETRVEIHRIMDRTAKEGGSLDDVLQAIETDEALLCAFMSHDDPAFDALKTRQASKRRKAN